MADRVPRVSHPGTLKIGDIAFDVAVLDDTDHTRIVTEANFMEAMGMYRSGALSTRRKIEEGQSAQIPLSLAYKNLKPFVEKHFGGVHISTIKYHNARGHLVTGGIPASVLPKLCEVWIDADRAGTFERHPRQKAIAEKADILLRGFAHVGIVALIDEATGYQEIRDRAALQDILDKYLLADHAKWAKRFPDDFYKNIFRLRDWQWRGMRVNRPSVVGHYTNDIVWSRLAPGVLEELRRLNPPLEGKRKAKHHQYLTADIGHPKLQEHLLGVLALMRASTSWDGFMRMLQRAYPKLNSTFSLPLSDADDSPSIH